MRRRLTVRRAWKEISRVHKAYAHSRATLGSRKTTPRAAGNEPRAGVIAAGGWKVSAADSAGQALRGMARCGYPGVGGWRMRQGGNGARRESAASGHHTTCRGSGWPGCTAAIKPASTRPSDTLRASLNRAWRRPASFRLCLCTASTIGAQFQSTDSDIAFVKPNHRGQDSGTRPSSYTEPPAFNLPKLGPVLCFAGLCSCDPHVCSQPRVQLRKPLIRPRRIGENGFPPSTFLNKNPSTTMTRTNRPFGSIHNPRS